MRWLGTLPLLWRVVVVVLGLEGLAVGAWCACRWPREVVAVCTVFTVAIAVTR
jgi:hypothetical protein